MPVTRPVLYRDRTLKLAKQNEGTLKVSNMICVNRSRWALGGQRCFGQQNRMLFWSDPQLIVEDVVPNFIQIVPIYDDPSVKGITACHTACFRDSDDVILITQHKPRFQAGISSVNNYCHDHYENPRPPVELIRTSWNFCPWQLGLTNSAANLCCKMTC